MESMEPHQEGSFSLDRCALYGWETWPLGNPSYNRVQRFRSRSKAKKNCRVKTMAKGLEPSGSLGVEEGRQTREEKEMGTPKDHIHSKRHKIRVHLKYKVFDAISEATVVVFPGKEDYTKVFLQKQIIILENKLIRDIFNYADSTKGS